MSHASSSDMDVGLAMLFGALAVAGAAVMYLAVDAQLLAATGFAIAVAAGALAIGALHVYGA
ncbi:DUF7525 family protein [Halapricum desulfuricans]|uniref:Putative membrane protein n=1 Tax=Halapricum desulfuricans TaxID=2841257 RepID=A0A897N4K0_9EURY|nr:hypothetical protein [Halapricum desulfuricans]QSG09320.1 putative membrane protein [Halapricum desulfuricans]QSG11960.1 putative membrane protein [Halapricum desulfuricans]